MKTILPGKLVTAQMKQPGLGGALASLPSRHPAEHENTMRAKLGTNRHFMAPQLSPDASTDKTEFAAREQVRTARERFLAQHGPGAELRKRERVRDLLPTGAVMPAHQVTSKELLKALRAAEMARWISFDAVTAVG